ncbi:MAG: hypothetical protein U1F30_02595 [Steroidobacteraceae bacterium]
MRVRRFGLWPLLSSFAVLAACGGGGGGDAGSNPPGPSPPQASYVRLTSDAGDYIGGGGTYSYTRANAQVTVTAQGARLTVSVRGDESWDGDFQLPNSYTSLVSGTYGGLTRYPFNNPVAGGLSWGGQGRGCNTLTGSITISKVSYSGGALSEIALQFEQRCEGGVPTLHGEIYWNAQDTTAPPGPVTPPPAGLWQPASGATPASGSYVYLESEPGDFVGGGGTHLYTQTTAILAVNAAGAHLSVSINGAQQWTGDFQGMNALGDLKVGYYGNLRRYPFHNPVKGGLSWFGEGRGCNSLGGWFVVDSVTYTNSALTTVDLRFEQRCEGGGPALHGRIHWDSSDTSAPTGPLVPVPAGLWQPAAGATPATGSYIYLESEPGDFVGGGASYLYTRSNAILTIGAADTHFSVAINGDQKWNGDFQAMLALTRLEVGYYGDLGRYPFDDPAKGGFSWIGESRGCNTAKSWVIVDSVTYAGSVLLAIDVRFEQHCEGGGPALHGKIHWDSSDTTSPPGPVVPPPSNLWQPAPGITPATGSYVYLESQPDDYVGNGASYLYTRSTASLTITALGGHLEAGIVGDQRWSGDFQAMNSLGRLEAGYYGDLRRLPFHNPAKGGLSWFGEGRGCNTLTGWFVVDNVTYSGSTMTAIDLRFEQHCEGYGPALHGKIHWDSADTTAPPGPVVPPPSNLWQPAPGVTPATGSYVYLESQAGDYIGLGRNYLYTQTNSLLRFTATGATLQLSVLAEKDWTGQFQAMNTLSRLEVGYYGDLRRYPFHNPATGGLSWYGDGRGCNVLTGWFVVDSVSYAGDSMTSIDLRFEQHCEGGGPALHGRIHWDSSDTSAPPGPVVPPPAGLWEPGAGMTPQTGSYVYLESQQGDYVGGGGNYLYSLANAALAVSLTDAHLTVAVKGDEQWRGDFQAMSTVNRLSVGYYGDVQRFPFNNPARSGMTWEGNSHACTTLTGWFVVDSITYVGSTLTAIDLRFEQHCEGGAPSLHGKIHWEAGDTTVAPGPVVPPPANLWQPAPDITPASGNYVYFESQPGDYIGLGGAYLYAPNNAQIALTTLGARLQINITGDKLWSGFFQGMNSLSRLEPGYYGNLQRYPFHNPARGGLDWSGDARGCNTLTGWFVVDNVSYTGVTLTAIDLRFEQHCEGGVPALHGKIHWTQ